jgi:hypothetical protein
VGISSNIVLWVHEHVINEAHEQAISNLAGCVNLDARLPDRVFTAGYADVYVMDFLNLFHWTAVELCKALVQQEGSSIVALGRFDRPKKESQDWRDDVIIVSPSTTGDDYVAFLTRNFLEFAQQRATPDMREPWRVFAERIGVCSNLGTWCIYGQMDAEIAVLGSKVRLTAEVEKRFHSEFGIRRLVDAMKRDTFCGEPGNEHSRRWRATLRSAYLP